MVQISWNLIKKKKIYSKKLKFSWKIFFFLFGSKEFKFLWKEKKNLLFKKFEISMKKKFFFFGSNKLKFNWKKKKFIQKSWNLVEKFFFLFGSKDK